MAHPEVENTRTRVYDTGKEGDDLHADIVADTRAFATSGMTDKQQKVARKLVRLKLLKLAEARGLHASPYLGEAFSDLLRLASL